LGLSREVTKAGDSRRPLERATKEGDSPVRNHPSSLNIDNNKRGMSFKGILTSIQNAWKSSGIQNYIKYIDPYQPAKILADKGRYDLGALYFMSWYVALGLLLARPKKKKETETEQKTEESSTHH
jgi:hypothetical protein